MKDFEYKVGDQIVRKCFHTGQDAFFVCIGVKDYGQFGKLSFWLCSVCGTTKSGKTLGLVF